VHGSQGICAHTTDALPLAPSASAIAAVPPAEGHGRPAPTRNAVLAAFQSARAAAPAAAAVAAPAPLVAPAPPVLAVAPAPPMTAAPLARVERVAAPAPNGQRTDAPRAAHVAPDLDALAEYVLDRLRRELRDGRERLGLLLDDSH
jgi:hypothetical protein